MTEFSTRTARIWLDDDGILVQEYLDGAEVALDDARENLAAFHALSRGERVRLLGRIDGLKSASSETRTFGASEEYAEPLRAIAIVTIKPIPRMIGNFWMKVSKPVIPTRIFAEEAEARAWLLTQ